MSEPLFLGVDGGQSHTEAVIADARGRVLGRGEGGPSNHADQPGGRERLRRAVLDSAGAALSAADLAALEATSFTSAHFAMTGGARDKDEVIRSLVRAARLVVGHDAPAAFAGATGGAPGVVVSAGTGSVAYGETQDGRAATIGGWGYLLGDEGSGFWIGVEALRRAVRAEDGMAPATRIAAAAIETFDYPTLRDLELRIYAGDVSRDAIAHFTRRVAALADEGDAVARAIIDEAGAHLARLAVAAADRLGLRGASVPVATAGGIFRVRRLRDSFVREVARAWPAARSVWPRFDSAIGALLLAYRQAGIDLAPILPALDAAARRPEATAS